MPLYELSRNPLSMKPRLANWWGEVKLRTKPGTLLAEELKDLEAGHLIVLAGDKNLTKRYEFFQAIAGWKGEEGAPILFRKIPPAEERQYMEQARGDAAFQEEIAEHCSIDPRLPRKVRREAEKAREKLEKLKARRTA